MTGLFRVAVWTVLCAATAAAGTFNFTGTFAQDDQLAFIQFSIANPTDVSLFTTSWAAGGFDPALAVFNAEGGLTASSLLVDQNNDISGTNLDSSLSFLPLAAGTYVAVVSQADNTAIGQTYGDGFVEAGMGNFTVIYGCVNGSFCAGDGSQRTNSWALTIQGVDSASSLSGRTPEPGTLFLLGGGLIGLGWTRRKALFKRF